MGTRRVLIVDDEPQLADILRLFLDHLGYEASVSGSADGAWLEVEADPAAHDLVVIDMSLPGMRGDELARRVLERAPRTRVIITSGYPTDVRALEAMAPGRVAFLHKPFTPEMLEAALRRLAEPPAGSVV